MENQRKQIETLQDRLTQRDEENSKLSCQLKAREESSQRSQDMMTMQHHDTRSQLSLCKSQMEEQKRTVERLQMDLIAKTDEISGLQSSIITLQNQCQQQEKQMLAKRDDLLQANLELTKEHEALMQQLEEEKKAAVRASKDIQELQLQVSEMRDEHDTELRLLKQNTRQESIALKCCIAELEEKLEDKEGEVGKLMKKMDRVVDKERKMSTAYDELLTKQTETKKSKVDEIDKLQDKISKLECSHLKVTTDLGSTVETLSKERDDLKTKYEMLQAEKNEVLSELCQSQQMADQVPAMKALMARKESSKAILLAEHAKLERKLNEVLITKESQFTEMEKELLSLQGENAALKSARLSRDSGGVHEMVDRSLMTAANSAGSFKAHWENSETGDIKQIQRKVEKMTALLAKKESDNRILLAELEKMKKEKSETELWWNRDVMEMNKRGHRQKSYISQLDRKMASLENENSHLRSISQSPSQRTVRTSIGTGAQDHDRILRESVYDLVERDGSVQAVVEPQPSQQEIQMRKLHGALIETTKLLEEKNSRAAHASLKDSTCQLDSLIKNLKVLPREESDAARTSQNHFELSRLHQRVNATIEQMQTDFDEGEKQKIKNEEERSAFLEGYVKQMTEMLESLRQSKAQEIQELTEENRSLQQMMMALEKERLSLNMHHQRAVDDVSSLESAKKAMEGQLKCAEAKAEQRQQADASEISKLRQANAELRISQERATAEFTSKLESMAKQQKELRDREIRRIYEKLTVSERSNSQLRAELNRSSEKLARGTKDIDTEITELHGEVHQLKMEKQILSDRFSEDCSRQVRKTEEILAEKNDELKRLSIRLAEQTNGYEVAHSEYLKQKQITQQLQERLNSLQEKLLKEKDLSAKSTMCKDKQLEEMKNQSDVDKRQLTLLLEKLTSLEIVNAKLKATAARYENLSTELSEKSSQQLDKLKTELSHKTAHQKALVSEIKQLKSALKSSEAKHATTEEQLNLMRADLKHNESVARMYKEEITSTKQICDAKIESMERHCKQRLNSVESGSKVTLETSKSNDGASLKLDHSEDLGTRVATLTNQLTTLTMRNDKLKTQNDRLDAKLMQMTETNAELRKTIQDMEHQKDVQYETALQKMQAQLDSLHKKLKQSAHNSDNMSISNTHQITKLKDELYAMKVQLNDQFKRNGQLQQQLDGTVKEAKIQSQSKISELTIKIKDLNSKLANERRNSSKKFEDNLSLAATLTKYKLQLEEAHRANKSLERYIANMKRSFSGLLATDQETNSQTPTRDETRRSSQVFQNSQHTQPEMPSSSVRDPTAVRDQEKENIRGLPNPQQ